MADMPIVRDGPADHQRLVPSQPAALHEDLPEPLDVVRQSLASVEAARDRFPGYRLARSTERQTIAASIVWLYRAGKDNVWLRRVPCTWHAADAISRR